MVQQLAQAGIEFGRRGFKRARSLSHGIFQRLQISQRVFTCYSLNTPHTRSYTAFAHNFEKTNVARGLNVGASAKLSAGANVKHAHGFAVFFAKEHRGAGFLGAFNVHHARMGCGIGQYFCIDDGFNLANFGVAYRRVVSKVKTGALGIDQAALLLHVAAQHFAQGFVHEVRGTVVAHGGGAQCGVHMGLYGVAHFQAATLQLAMVAKHISLDFLGIQHMKLGAAALDQPLVAHLATGLGVERCGVQHHHAHLAGLEFLCGCALEVQGQHFGVGRQAVVAHKVVARA